MNGGVDLARVRRLTAVADWTWVAPQLGEQDNLRNDGASVRFAHTGKTTVDWELPVQSGSISLALDGAVHFDAIGTATPQFEPDRARVSGGAAYRQTVELIRGELIVEGGLRHHADIADDRLLDQLLQADQPVAELPGMNGLRYHLTVRYTF